MLKKNVLLEEVTKSGFQLDWDPVSSAQHYELKYIFRIPEGRTLIQRDAIGIAPFYMFQTHELPQVDLVHLIVEVTTQCEITKSAPNFIQIALKNSASTCHFDTQTPTLNNDELSWPLIKEAQSYVMCFYKEDKQTFCQETVNTQNKINRERASLIGVAPICNNVAGLPIYISVMKGALEDLE